MGTMLAPQLDHHQTAGTDKSEARSVNRTVRPDVKLQVFCKDGCYYALDENALRCYQQLEGNGSITAVEVEVVSCLYKCFV